MIKKALFPIRYLMDRFNKAEKPEYLVEFPNKKIEIEQLYQMRLQSITKVHQPMVLISQIQRSGGTLLSQLFDAHPQCYVHPLELYIGYPQKWIWPNLDLNGSPDTWFENLYESRTTRLFRYGYQKFSNAAPQNKETFPFVFLPNLQRKIFKESIRSIQVLSQRDILNCYMTSYFNAWLDYQDLYTSEEKKYVVAFTPRVNMYASSVERFFADYPDGKLISIIREPKSWYVSASRHSANQYPSIEEAIGLWMKSAQAMLDNKCKFGDQVYLIAFENLLQNLEDCMRSLAVYLNLEYDQCLLVPTFQGMRIKANSSYEADKYGVLKDPVNRKSELNDREKTSIDEMAMNLYQKVLTEIDRNRNKFE
jgi:hypothetical protein